MVRATLCGLAEVRRDRNTHTERIDIRVAGESSSVPFNENSFESSQSALPAETMP